MMTMMKRTSTLRLARRARLAPTRADARSVSNSRANGRTVSDSYPSFLEEKDTPAENDLRHRFFGPEGGNVQALKGLDPNVPPLTSCDKAFKKLTKNPAFRTHESSFLLLPWGLVPQDKVQAEVAPEHEKGIHTSDKLEVYNSPETMDFFLKLTGGREQLCEGAREAYLYFASLWNRIPRSVTPFSTIDTMSLALEHVLQECAFAYHKAGVNPMVDIKRRDVEVDLLNIWIEEGSVHRGKTFGFYDWYEIKYQFLSGIVGPELRLFSGKRLLGKPPRHLCAAFRIKSVDRLGVRLEESGEIIEGSPRSSCHYWVMETDWRSESLDPDDQDFKWRIRNINSAINPIEKARLPLAEVEH